MKKHIYTLLYKPRNIRYSLARSTRGVLVVNDDNRQGTVLVVLLNGDMTEVILHQHPKQRALRVLSNEMKQDSKIEAGAFARERIRSGAGFLPEHISILASVQLDRWFTRSVGKGSHISRAKSNFRHTFLAILRDGVRSTGRGHNIKVPILAILREWRNTDNPERLLERHVIALVRALIYIRENHANREDERFLKFYALLETLRKEGVHLDNLEAEILEFYRTRTATNS